jgi:hypothetical protein
MSEGMLSAVVLRVEGRAPLSTLNSDALNLPNSAHRGLNGCDPSRAEAFDGEPGRDSEGPVGSIRELSGGVLSVECPATLSAAQLEHALERSFSLEYPHGEALRRAVFHETSRRAFVRSTRLSDLPANRQADGGQALNINSLNLEGS